jgi:catechol 2,3-dioxygenase-like lactoylglutathione lyase family enzyme
MPFARLAHVAFQVRDLDASLAFYSEGMGMREQFRITYAELLEQMENDAQAGNRHDVDDATIAAFEAHRDQAWIVYIEVAPLQFIELFPAIAPESLTEPLVSDSYSHLCLEVEDIEATAAEFVARGIELDRPISTGLDKSRQFWVADPDGHRIEIMQYTAQSYQLTRG